MAPEKTQSPEKEQKICITCGFCCDGTLFHNALLEPGERGNLPEKMEQNYLVKGDQEYFKLPCLYFNQQCTIYHEKKANICSAFRCQLLKSFAEKKLTRQEALEIVRKSRITRDELFETYKNISGNQGDTTFRQLLVDLGKLQKANAGGESDNMPFKQFNARCNIFESLLIRYFKSEKNFQSMIAPKDKKDTSD